MSATLKSTAKFTAWDLSGNTKWQSKSVKSTAAVPPTKKSVSAPAVPSSTGSASAVDYEQVILTTIANDGLIADTWELAKILGVDHQVLVGVIKSLLVDAYVVEEPLSTSYWTLTTEGEQVAEQGSPEMQVLNAVPAGEEGIPLAELQKSLGAVAKVGMGQAMKNGWIKKNGDRLVRSSTAADAVDDTARILRLVRDGNDAAAITAAEDVLKTLKKRKLTQQVTRKSVRVTRGPDFRPVRVRKVADLNKSMLGNKAEMEPGTHWSDLSFKSINLKSMGAPAVGGNYHPLLKVRAEFRRILMEMGFEEMPTSKWVESSFWNFDALFQPQSHPARDAHDTFFMKSPAAARGAPEPYYSVVKQTHEDGGSTGSIGYGCNFKREEAMKNILRTHTTAISAQMLYRLGQACQQQQGPGQGGEEGGAFTPKKYFSIDRVFRNEAMDQTHLCEFHQVEGLVADRNLTLGHLIGTIKTFFEKIGITQLRFKPAYNPYTEPSMEIFGYHPELKKWTEIGNSGMFRPEMLRPMGLPSDVRVIAWGLSLERPTMIKYSIENIRDLFGHKADLQRQCTAPIARF